MLDQLDSGGGFDLEALEGDDTDMPPVQTEPCATPPEETPPPAPSHAPAETLAEVTPGKLDRTILQQDPLYRQIFTDLVTKALTALEALLATWSDTDSPQAARNQITDLSFAAEQLGLNDWVAVMESFLSGKAAQPDTQEMHRGLRSLFDRDLGEGAPATDAQADCDRTAEEADWQQQGTDFFAAISELYPELADQGMRMFSDTPPDDIVRRDLGDRIVALASPLNLVGVLDAAQRLATVQKGEGYRAAELVFYEELVRVERSLPHSVFGGELIAPSQLLGAWCADHVFETLQDLRKGLEPGPQASGKAWFPQFETLMRRVHYACLNFQIDMASQLTMALLDLFARVRIDDKVPDVILLQMGRGFVDTMELVFDALTQGDTPDIARIEQMFAEATNVCFVASGVVTAKTIETQLGLPPEFHRVLSPESVKSAHEAIEDGLNFFVLRADLNDDDALAQGFLEWITSGLVRMITNVTVFQDTVTLFDFLVASVLDEGQLTERLMELDPQGGRLRMMQALATREPPAPDTTETDPETATFQPIGDAGDTLALLEAVGAISASHSLLEHELTKLASIDLMQEFSMALRTQGHVQLDPGVRGILRDLLDQHSLQLRELSEAGAQLSAELGHLQQESVAQRSRPAEVLLRPLQAHIATRSRAAGNEATMTYVGGDVVLDQHLIGDLRQVMKPLLNLRLGADHAPTRFHVSVESENDHVLVELTDDGLPQVDSLQLSQLSDVLRRKKGTLRHVALPGGAGMRFQLRVPHDMIVLDGMVVRVGQVRYVLPVEAIQRILQTDQLLPVTAAASAQMLNLGDDGLVPVRKLMGNENPDNGQLFVILRNHDRRIAIPVDELLGQQLVLLRPLQGVLSSVRDMSGIAILSGGEVGMVVAVSALVAMDRDKAA